jgi:hypothetical protein
MPRILIAHSHSPWLMIASGFLSPKAPDAREMKTGLGTSDLVGWRFV